MMNKTLAGFILAAGYGKRMGRYTLNIPKPLLSVDGVPLLHYQFFHLYRCDVENVWINAHYRYDRILEYLRIHRLGDFFRIHFIHEPELLGTAGALRNVFSGLSGFDGIMLLNSDVILFPDDGKLPGNFSTQDWEKIHSSGLLYLRPRTPADSAERAWEFCPNSPKVCILPGGKFIYTGYSILGREILKLVPSSPEKELGPLWETLNPGNQNSQKMGMYGTLFQGNYTSVGNATEYDLYKNQNLIPDFLRKDWESFIQRISPTGSGKATFFNDPWDNRKIE